MLLGLNIGKNAATPIERAVDDYLACLDGVYPHADYVTINISSPNTKPTCARCRATRRSTRCWARWPSGARHWPRATTSARRCS
jgi:hypothetical protein